MQQITLGYNYNLKCIFQEVCPVKITFIIFPTKKLNKDITLLSQLSASFRIDSI